MNRTDLQQLATTRLAEAKSLLAAGHPSGTYYLAGYALECALKARIASFTQASDFPDKRKAVEAYTHALRDLIKAASLASELQREVSLKPAFAAFWTIVLNWDEESRYRQTTMLTAQELITAIDDPQYGVLQWLTLYW